MTDIARSRHCPAWARIAWLVARLAAFGVATWYLAVPQVPLMLRSLKALKGVNPLMIGLGVGLAFMALVAYAQLMRVLLDDGTRPGFWHAFGIITTSLGINRVVPAGAAVGGLVTFRLLERAGVERRRAAFVMAVQSIGSALVLNAILWIALVAALPSRGFVTSYTVSIGVGAAAFAVVGCLIDALLHRRAWLLSLVKSTKGVSRRAGVDDTSGLIEYLSGRLTGLAGRPRTMRVAVGWAVTNWLLDIAALWIFLMSFGVGLDPVAVTVAFALANIAAFLPVTPGGLGVVDLTLVATLTGFGAAAIPAALGVAAYRVFNYWVPIPLSLLAYCGVRYHHVSGHSVAAALPVIADRQRPVVHSSVMANVLLTACPQVAIPLPRDP